MRQTDDYIPIDIWHEAKDFVKEVTDEVEIYKIILQTAALKPCEEADKFCAYWNLKSYEKYPYALITLYEAKNLIDKKLLSGDVMNAFEVQQMRMKNYYLFLKDKGLINE